MKHVDLYTTQDSCFIQSRFVSIGSNGNYRCASGGRRQAAPIHGGSVNNRRRGRSLPSCRSPQLPPEAASVGLAVSGGFYVLGLGKLGQGTGEGNSSLNPGYDVDVLTAETLRKQQGEDRGLLVGGAVCGGRRRGTRVRRSEGVAGGVGFREAPPPPFPERPLGSPQTPSREEAGVAGTLQVLAAPAAPVHGQVPAHLPLLWEFCPSLWPFTRALCPSET